MQYNTIYYITMYYQGRSIHRRQSRRG